jgi:molybdenum cofactor guanylyltransferase
MPSDLSSHRLSQPAFPPALTAIILAGGLSSRMGEDKALIEINGLPLLLRVAEVAKQMADSVYVVTAWGERYQALCAAAEIELIAEPLQADRPQGPLCGFLQGLSQIPTPARSPAQSPALSPGQNDWLLLLACDLPNLRVEPLRAWQSRLAAMPPEVMALLPRSAGGAADESMGGWEPLCGFYRRQCQPSLQAFVAAGGRSFQVWLAQQSVQALPVDDPTLLLNCNTPADLQQIQSQ